MPSARILIRDSGLRGPQGDTGPAGPSGTGGLPTGGTDGQVVTKSGAGAVWATPSGGTGVPNGGTLGQILVKQSSTNGDATWNTPVKATVGLGLVDNTADGSKSVASAASLTTARSIDGQAFDGTASITVVAPASHAATSKTTPADADEVPLVDTAASNILKKLTLTNLATYVKGKILDTNGFVPIANMTPWTAVYVFWNGTNWKLGTATVTSRAGVVGSRSDLVIEFIDTIGTASFPGFGLSGVDQFRQKV